MFLIIDNYDSFVFNLADYVHQTGHKTLIVKNDQVTETMIMHLKPLGIIISPGPKHPKDAGNIVPIIQKFYKKLPILGICLGHQAIGYAFGATITQTPPCHGIASKIMHSDQLIFKNIPQSISVGRYHSLGIIKDQHFPNALEITAQTSDNLIMAIKHKTYPVFGLQFHPESILTEYGLSMIQNFVTLNDVHIL